MKDKNGIDFPDYARMHYKGEEGGTAIKFIEFRRGYAEYYRVCGDWSAYFRYRDGKFICTNTPHGSDITSYMKGAVLTPITREEHDIENPYGRQELADGSYHNRLNDVSYSRADDNRRW